MATLSPSFYLTLSIDKVIWLGVTGENGEGRREREGEIWLSTLDVISIRTIIRYDIITFETMERATIFNKVNPFKYNETTSVSHRVQLKPDQGRN